MEKETIVELQERVKALQILNDLLLKQAVEHRKLFESMDVDKESSLEKWIV